MQIAKLVVLLKNRRRMQMSYTLVGQNTFSFSNKSKFLVTCSYITTCIVIVTYYTCKCQRNIKALGLSYCKNNEIKRLNQKLFPYVYDLLSNNSPKEHIFIKNRTKKNKQPLNKKHMNYIKIQCNRYKILLKLQINAISDQTRILPQEYLQ